MAFQQIDHDEDDDPLSGVANLFDLGVVFALGLMLVATGQLPPEAWNAQERTGGVETPAEATQKLPRFRVSEESLKGQGERLGVAYRLANGEVVYVPEPRSPSEEQP